MMDTNQVADKLGTTPRRLRQFLRSQGSTFQAVGSGARYEFTDRDLPTLNSRFHEWNGSKAAPMQLITVTERRSDDAKDRKVWDEEGPIVLEDIRIPKVRERVRRIAAEQEARLDMRLLAAGLHITQMRVRQAG